MSNNIVDLSNLDTNDLTRELVRRGHNITLLYSREDVDWELENLNESTIKLTDEQKDYILDYVLDNESITDNIAEQIRDNIKRGNYPA